MHQTTFTSRPTCQFVTLVLLGFLAAPAPAHQPPEIRQPPWQQASPWPDRVIVTLSGPPSESFAVNWRTEAGIERPIARIARAVDAPRFDRIAREVRADTEVVDLERTRLDGVAHDLAFPLNIGQAHFHSVEFSGLEPDTLYVYQVCGRTGYCSEWFQTRTAAAPDAGETVRFIYLGDAQNGLLSHFSRVVRAGFSAAPQADFILHAGDLVDHASRDLEWAQWFKAVGFIHGMVPAVPVAGNHEYDKLEIDGELRRAVLSVMWRPQFRLPLAPDLPEVLQETVYALDYNDDLDLFVLNTQAGMIEAQAEWLDRALARSTATWQIVAMHHPVFSTAEERDNLERREAVLPILRKHGVNLVLQGHDHTYSRGVDNIQPRIETDDQGAGTVFITSVSGAKMYRVKPERWDQYSDDAVLERAAENTQFFQLIELDGARLKYRSHTATGELYDAFQLVHDDHGTRLIERDDLPAERDHDNTVPYDGIEDLDPEGFLADPDAAGAGAARPKAEDGENVMDAEQSGGVH